MFKDYLFFSNNLQDAARQILEAQEAQAKKENEPVESEDETFLKPMPGYSSAFQDPNLRSDEDAEKTKEWYTSVAGNKDSSIDRQGNKQVYTSGVDSKGRPTGYTNQETIESPENFKKRVRQEASDRLGAEKLEAVGAQRQWDEDAYRLKIKREAEEGRRLDPDYDKKQEIEKQRQIDKEERKQELLRQRGPMPELG